MKEAQDLAVNPIENCNAAPLEHNIFEWHANISTPLYEGAAFHFVIEFPHAYPKKAPKVRVCNHINHPNVFGSYLCLDILTMSEETETTPYRGWTSAYTVSSLLVQLQCFLFDLGKDDKLSPEEHNRQYQGALNYKCAKCGHCGTDHYPKINAAKREPGFYSLRRLTRVRSGVGLDSKEICTLPQERVVQVVGFNGRRAKIDLSPHAEANGAKSGYCSVYTAKGVLLTSLLGNLCPGVYKANCEVDVVTSACTKICTLQTNEQVTVINATIKGGTLLAKVTTLPLKYRSLRSLNINNAYVNATKLRLVSKLEEPMKEIVLSGESYWLHEFYGEVLDIILSMLDDDTVNAISLCHADLKSKVDKSKILLMRNYRCFYTLKTMREENVVIGYGIKTDIMDKRSRHRMMKGRNGRVQAFKRPVLQRLHPSFDFMTFEAFDQHLVKTNVWKDVVFDSFLPLYINKTHGKAALPLAEKCMLNMWKKENRSNSLTCERVLETLAKLMNTTIVNMNKCIEDLEVEEIQLFDSIKAIEGYMNFHHLLLAFAMKYPQLVNIANDKIRNFCKNETIRDKEFTPDVGELIVYLSISKYSWKQFCPALLREIFDRNVRWILAKYPGLREVEGDKDRSCIRLSQSFLATKTGKRLAAFQSFFMNEIACPPELQRNEDKVKILFNEYNARLGKPADGVAVRLQIHSRKVLAMSNWFDYFELIGFAAPTSVELCSWLRQSITRSAEKKYHTISQILRYKENHVESPNNILHKNPYNCMCAGGQVFNLKNAVSADTCKLVMKPKERIDIAIVIDCTGSMASWLTQAKKHIQAMIQSVNEKTQFKKVRFALVPYRDHGRAGMGHNGYVVQEYDFTESVSQMQKYVDSLQAGGGDDAPEAMSCGLATAANLTWNDQAMRLIIHVGDEKPHGCCPHSHDNYPDGCPDGHDALRVVHNLAKKGIPIYNVYCGHSSGGLTETFYHALSHITGGQCLKLTDASTLSKIVLGAAMEEQTMDRMSKKIMPVWDHVHERHPNARDDQIIYELYQRLKAEKFQVQCVLGGRQLGKSAMKSIETIAFCMDLKQVKAMQTAAGEHFYSYSTGNGQLTSETTKLVTEGQVRKWYKRNKKIMAIRQFMKQGCLYAQPCWQAPAAQKRLELLGIGKFGKRSTRPWAQVDRRALRQMFNEAGKLATETIRGTPLSCPRGSAVKAPTSSAWGSSGTSKSSGYVPPHRRPRNDPPAPVSGPSHLTSVPGYVVPTHLRAATTGVAGSPPRNIGAAAQRAVQHRNPTASSACCRSAHPRNTGATPRSEAQPQASPVQPAVAWGSMGSSRPMARNTSYPVNNGSRSVSHASDGSSHFPGRGLPIQTIRNSRSNSATRGTSRNSRSNSREPQRSTMTNTRISSPPTNAHAFASRPPAAYHTPRTTSRSSSGSSTTAYPKSVVVSFDSNKILTDFINSRFQEAGVSKPTIIEIKNNHACITFASVGDADQVKQRMSSGTPLRVSSVEAFRQTKV